MRDAARGAADCAGRALQSFDFLSEQHTRCEAQIEALSPPGNGGDAPTASTKKATSRKAPGGRPLPGRTRKVARALRIAAVAARRSQTFFSAKHRALLSRRDKPVATAATARDLPCLIQLIAPRREEYAARTVVNLERRAG